MYPKFIKIDIVVRSLVILWHFSILLNGQQQYSEESTFNCTISDKAGPSPAFLYTCNGQKHRCAAYLIFRSQPTYNSATSIGYLASSPVPELSRVNNITTSELLPSNSEVIVPVKCSCSGKYYQATTSYNIQTEYQTYYNIANETFEGLSSCNALRHQNPYEAHHLKAGFTLRVPLRCACPTKKQTSEGIKFLLTYLVTGNDTIANLSERFNVSTLSIVEANRLSKENATLYPFTTILIPLQTIPSTSQLIDPALSPSQQTPPNSRASSPKGSRSNNIWIYTVTGTLGGISLVSLSTFLFYWFCFIKRGNNSVVPESFESVQQPIPRKPSKDLSPLESLRNNISSIAKSLTIYSYEELTLATENFSPSSFQGGSVYRGTLKGDFAAIKKVSGDVFEEINLLNNIKHLNIISLWGVCYHDGYWYLVFEYAAKGALSDWIYGKHEEEDKFLNWMQRIQIAFDVASGLNYLHSYTSPPYVHKDLKCSNVLLDANFRAKITNFNQARATEAEEGHFALTRHIIGAKGYMAPEYLENGLVSPKLDVYSFGVLLLEILTAKEVAANLHMPENVVSILDETNENQMLSDFIDPSLRGDFPSDLAILLIKLVESCLKKDPSARPDMHQIVQTLSETINATTSWESEQSV